MARNLTARPGAPVALLQQFATLVAAIVIWLLFAIGPGSASGIPTPLTTVKTAVKLMGGSAYWGAIGNTILTAVIGLLLAIAIGIPLGLINGSSRKVALSSQFLVDFGRTIPGVGILPLVLLVFGGTRPMALALVVFGAVWPLLIQSTYAVQQVSPQMHQVGRAFHLTLRDRIRSIYVPSATPFIMTGLRVSATISLLLSISAEFLGGVDGIGRELFDTLTVNDSDTMFVYAFTAALLGVALNWLLLQVQKRVLWWHPSQREKA